MDRVGRDLMERRARDHRDLRIPHRQMPRQVVDAALETPEAVDRKHRARDDNDATSIARRMQKLLIQSVHTSRDRRSFEFLTRALRRGGSEARSQLRVAPQAPDVASQVLPANPTTDR